MVLAVPSRIGSEQSAVDEALEEHAPHDRRDLEVLTQPPGAQAHTIRRESRDTSEDALRRVAKLRRLKAEITLMLDEGPGLHAFSGGWSAMTIA